MRDGSDIALLEVRLGAVAFEAERVQSYVLEPLYGQSLPPFTAGAHIDLHLPNGLVRSYSLLNNSQERYRYVIGVQNDPNSRGGSRYMHDTLRLGEILTCGVPRNSFALYEDAPHSVLIAGGIGITPLLSMIERLATIGRSWELHYACRTRARTAFLDRLQQLAGDHPNRLHMFHAGEAGGERLDISTLVSRASPDAHLYCCGPPSMLAAFEQAAANRPAAQNHVEYFAARDAAAVAGGYHLVLSRSGQEVAVEPGQTMLAALLAAGVDVAFACTQGVCGTCETGVLSGVPDHRDAYLTETERATNKTVMVCCSGSRTPMLVLDL